MRRALDESARSAATAQIQSSDAAVARDIALHVDRWSFSGASSRCSGFELLVGDAPLGDLTLIAELLKAAAQRR